MRISVFIARWAKPNVSIVNGVMINERMGLMLTLTMAKMTATAIAGKKPWMDTPGNTHANTLNTRAEITNL